MEKKFITIEDTTLREGEQTPGLVLDYNKKHKIITSLIEAGIKYIEVGIPIMGSVEYNAIRKLVKEFGSSVTLIGWNRGLKKDLEASFDVGVNAIHIGLPSSEVHIHDKFNKTRSWVLDTACELIGFAKEKGAKFISISAEDMGRADMDFLVEYAKLVEKEGASRLRLSDTIGCLIPDKVFTIVKTLKQHTQIDLQMHMHNDFNLAIANTIKGVEAGANQIHCTINGLGERTGITSLHQAAIAMEILCNYSTGIDMKKLFTLSTLVSEYTNMPIPRNEPVIGENAFKHESGIHVDGMLKVKDSFQAFDPEMVGRKHQFVLGKHTGSSAVKYFLEQEGITISKEEAASLLPFIREFSTLYEGAFSPDILSLFWKQAQSLKASLSTRNTPA